MINKNYSLMFTGKFLELENQILLMFCARSSGMGVNSAQT